MGDGELLLLLWSFRLHPAVVTAVSGAVLRCVLCCAHAVHLAPPGGRLAIAVALLLCICAPSHAAVPTTGVCINDGC